MNGSQALWTGVPGSGGLGVLVLRLAALVPLHLCSLLNAIGTPSASRGLRVILVFCGRMAERSSSLPPFAGKLRNLAQEPRRQHDDEAEQAKALDEEASE